MIFICTIVHSVANTSSQDPRSPQVNFVSPIRGNFFFHIFLFLFFSTGEQEEQEAGRLDRRIDDRAKCYTKCAYLPLLPRGQGGLGREEKLRKIETGRDQRHFLWGGGLSMQPPRLDRDNLAGVRKEAFALKKHEAVLGDEVHGKSELSK